MPDKLPPEKAARNRRQAKAEKNGGTTRSVTLTEGINVEPNVAIDIHFSKWRIDHLVRFLIMRSISNRNFSFIVIDTSSSLVQYN